MAIHYKIDVLKWLRAAGFNSGRLRREKLLGQSTLTKLRRGELLSWGETGRVCEMLHCQPGDLFVYFPETAEGAKVPGPSEYQRGVDVIAAAVGASGETITACATRAHMSAITIAEAVNKTDSQLVCLGDYLLEFADGVEAEARAAGDGAEAEAVTVEPADTAYLPMLDSKYNLDSLVEEITENGEDYIDGLQRHIDVMFPQFAGIDGAHDRVKKAVLDVAAKLEAVRDGFH